MPSVLHNQHLSLQRNPPASLDVQGLTDGTQQLVGGGLGITCNGSRHIKDLVSTQQ